MKYIGAHISAAGGLDRVPFRAFQINGTAFSFFTKNPRKWFSDPLTTIEIHNFKKSCLQYKFTSKQILPHSSYLINLGHPINEKIQKSRLAFVDDMLRCAKLGVNFLNVHPGSHLGKVSENTCLEIISESINWVLKKTKDVTIVLENTAGQGNNIGYCFEHLSEIIKNVDDKSRIGVCLDTCHLFSSGYDLRTSKDCENTFKRFDELIGLHYLKGLHLNDSKTLFNSRIDRHENLGLGKIGKIAFKWIVRNKNFYDIPMILETSNSNIWKEEIFWLQSKTSQ